MRCEILIVAVSDISLVASLKHFVFAGIFREKIALKNAVHIANPEIIQEMYTQEEKYPLRNGLKLWIAHCKERNHKLNIILL